MEGRWAAGRRLALWGWAGGLLGSFLMHSIDLAWWIAAGLGSLSFVYLLRRACGLRAWSLGGQSQGEDEADHYWVDESSGLGTRITHFLLNLLLWLGSSHVLVTNKLPLGLSD